MYPNLRAEMARKNITMSELAKKAGMRPSTLSLKANGKNAFTLDEAMKIQEILNVEMSIDELFEKEIA